MTKWTARYQSTRMAARFGPWILFGVLLSTLSCGGGRGSSTWSPLAGEPTSEGGWTRITYQPPFPVRELNIAGNRLHFLKSRHEIVTASEPGEGLSLVVQGSITSEESLGRAVAASLGSLFVSNAGSNAILGFSLDGTTKFRLQVPPSGKSPARITALAWQPATGQLWGVDTAHHRVMMWNPTLGESPVRIIGQRGGGPLEFNYPSDLAIEPSGSILILDTLNRRVQRLDERGDLLEILFVGHTTLSRPVAITVDSDGNIWVYDDFTGKLHGFTHGGSPLVDEQGTPVQLEVPMSGKGLFADSRRRLWISSPLQGTLTTLTPNINLLEDTIVTPE